MKHSKDPVYRELITSNRWRLLRARKLTQQPFCERCKAAGILTWATEVHHIRPIESVGGREAKTALAFSMNNLQSLCHSCHVEAHKELGRLSKASITERAKNRCDNFERRFFGEENEKKK